MRPRTWIACAGMFVLAGVGLMVVAPWKRPRGVTLPTPLEIWAEVDPSTGDPDVSTAPVLYPRSAEDLEASGITPRWTSSAFSGPRIEFEWSASDADVLGARVGLRAGLKRIEVDYDATDLRAEEDGRTWRRFRRSSRFAYTLGRESWVPPAPSFSVMDDSRVARPASAPAEPR